MRLANTRPDLALAIVLGCASAFALRGGEALAGKRVTLCHVPPGNEANAHTISVGEAAVGAHLAHGDELGACVTGCGANPSICDDGNACTWDDCADGQCVHETVSCDDGNPCTVDACDATLGCTAAADDGATCEDGNACTTADACIETVCQGWPIENCCASDEDCDDDAECTIDVCGGGFCSNEPVDCSVPDLCWAGFCDIDGECGTTPIDCDDADFCTDDGCDGEAGCFHDPTASPPEPVEVSCTDGLDNDCDGSSDAVDSDCFVCGDGVQQPGEECDDGNSNPFDGCDHCIFVDTTPD